MSAQLMFNNYINFDADTERHKVGGDETGETVLVEVGGIVVKAYLIIVKSDQATTLVSTPTTLLFTIINVVHH